MSFPTSDSVACCAATAIPPDGGRHQRALFLPPESGHRSAKSARTTRDDSATGDAEVADSSRNTVAGFPDTTSVTALIAALLFLQCERELDVRRWQNYGELARGDIIGILLVASHENLVAVDSLR
jgi:hypothetical protein